MKKFTLFLLLSTFSLAVLAAEAPTEATVAPKVYFKMYQGRLVEYHNGKFRKVRKDVTLVNRTTIHPNGAIDASSGQSLQLQPDEYMTTDGRIRKLKDMHRRRHSN